MNGNSNKDLIWHSVANSRVQGSLNSLLKEEIDPIIIIKVLDQLEGRLRNKVVTKLQMELALLDTA